VLELAIVGAVSKYDVIVGLESVGVVASATTVPLPDVV
jgi:hypothetical protein